MRWTTDTWEMRKGTRVVAIGSGEDSFFFSKRYVEGFCVFLEEEEEEEEEEEDEHPVISVLPRFETYTRKALVSSSSWSSSPALIIHWKYPSKDLEKFSFIRNFLKVSLRSTRVLSLLNSLQGKKFYGVGGEERKFMLVWWWFGGMSDKQHT